MIANGRRIVRGWTKNAEIYNIILIFLNSPIFGIRQILFSLRNYIADFVIKYLSTCADANNYKVIKF